MALRCGNGRLVSDFCGLWIPNPITGVRTFEQLPARPGDVVECMEEALRQRGRAGVEDARAAPYLAMGENFRLNKQNIGVIQPSNLGTSAAFTITNAIWRSVNNSEAIRMRVQHPQTKSSLLWFLHLTPIFPSLHFPWDPFSVLV